MRLCVIGDPVGHSLSPLLHRRMLDRAGLTGSYETVTVTPDTLPEFLAAARAGAWDGCNVTMPLKQAILPLLDELDRQKDELDLLHRREVEELRRRCDQLTRIPAEEYIAYSELVNKAGDVWHKAKEKDDFAMFCPLLQELVEYNRKFAAYYDSTRAPYDALLNEYERGVDTKMLDEFFATLRQTIVPLLQKIARKPQIDDSFLHNYYPVDKQKAFADYLMQVMGLDRGHCGLGETEQEVLQTLADLREAGVDIVTIGQYLQPTRKHLPVQQYVHPDIFARYRRDALAMGFRYVQSGPLVRSSYHAAEQVFPLDPAE